MASHGLRRTGLFALAGLTSFFLSIGNARATSCAGGYATVCASGCNQTTISAAVGAIPAAPLSGDYCVDIQGNGPYNEQVTLSGKNPNNFQIIIGTTSGSARPVVKPPALSTAAFQIVNSSVTLANIVVAPANSMPYGIDVSSDYVTISSCSLQDPTGKITTAGAALLANHDMVSFSSVTANNAHAFLVTGQFDGISASTAITTGSSQRVLYLNGASSGTFTGLVLMQASGNVLVVDNGGAYNTISLSTMINNGSSPAVDIFSSSNTFSQDYFSSPGNPCVEFDASASYNLVQLSTAVGGGSAGSLGCLLFNGDSFDMVTQSIITSQTGDAVDFINTTADDTISQSTIAVFGACVGLPFQFQNRPSSHTLTQDYIDSTACGSDAIMFGTIYGGGYNTISFSTINAGGTAVTLGTNFSSLQRDIVATQGTLNSPGTRISGSFDTVIQSTFNTTNSAALLVIGASATISNCYIQGSTAVWVSGATGTVVGASVLISAATGNPAVWLDNANNLGLSLSSDTILGGAQSADVYIDKGNAGIIRLSTNTILAGAQYGIYVATQAPGTQVWITSNTILPTVTAAWNTYGLYLNGLTSGATIQNNGIYYRNSGAAATTYGLFAQSASGLNVDHNRIDDPGMITGGSFTGAYFLGSQRVTFKFNDVNSTGTSLANAYLAQWINSSGVSKDDVFASSLTVTGSSATVSIDAASGVSADYNDYFSSNAFNTIILAGVSHQNPFNETHSIALNPLWSNPSAGVEDFHPLSQTGRCSNPPACTTFAADGAASPTIDAADPAEPFSLEPAPNGGRANQGSFGGTAQASESSSPPASPGVSAVFISSITVSWTAVQSNGYVVQASTAPDFSGTVISSSTSNATVTLLTVSGLAGSTTYYLRVGAVYGGSNIYAVPATNPSLTLAAPVSGAQLYAIYPTSVTVNWIALSSQAASYRFDASTDPAFGVIYASSGTPNLALSTLTISNLAVDATFYFRVDSLNWSGIPTYAVVGSTYLATGPSPVASLATAASTTTDTQAVLTWTAPGGVWDLGTAVSYNIRYSPSPITPANFASATIWKSSRPVSGPLGTAEREVITGLTGGVTYYFALETANSSGNVSGLSNLASYLAGQDVVPFVASVSPSGGPPVSVSTTVAIKFSKIMSTATFSGVTITAVADNIGNAISQPVAGTTNYLQAAETLVFTPAAPLSKNYTYLVSVSTAVKDPSGNPLPSVSSATFTTFFDHTALNVVSGGQGARFTVPANAFSSDGSLSAAAATADVTAQNATQKLLARDAFSNPVTLLAISATDGSGNPLQPAVPVSVTLPYSDNGQGFVAGVSPTVRANTLAVWWLDSANALWEKLPGSSVDTQGHSITAQLPHFSTFGLIGAQNTSLAGAFAYPVPYVPSKQATRVITFQNLSSVATIRIYTVSGLKVRELSTSDGTGKVVWDVKNSNGQDVASGVYLYVISNDKESAKGKVIVVR